jgi:hypothetical protein
MRSISHVRNIHFVSRGCGTVGRFYMLSSLRCAAGHVWNVVRAGAETEANMDRNLVTKMSTVAFFGSGLVAGIVLFGSVSAALQSRPTPSDLKALDVLIAKDQIRDQIYNYSRGLDRMDRALALQVFHPDAVVTQPNGTGGGFKGNGEDWVNYAWSAHSKIAAHAHQMTNILIRVDGDKATSETYAMDSLRAEPSENSASTNLILVRYVDAWSKRNGRWAIDTRNIIIDFSTNNTSATPNRKGVARRDKSDPSYVALK